MRFQTHIKLKFMAALVIALAFGIGIAHAQTLMTITSQGLPMNKIVQAAARINQDAYTYFFNTTENGTFYLLIDSSTLQDGPSFIVQDLTTNETVGIFRTTVTGACLQLDNTPSRYQLTVMPGSAVQQQDYHLMLWQESEMQLDCPISKLTGKQNVVADGASPWEATTKGLQSVNLRVAPSVNSSIIGVLDPNVRASIIGETSDGRWLALKVSETTAWVSADVVNAPKDGWRGLPIMDVPNYVPNVVSSTNNGNSQVNVQGNVNAVVNQNTLPSTNVQDNNGNNGGSTGGNGGSTGGNGGSTGNNGGSTVGNGGTTSPTAVPATPVPPPVVVPTSVPAPVETDNNTVNVTVGGNTSGGVSVNVPIIDNTLNTVTCVVGGLLGGSCP